MTSSSEMFDTGFLNAQDAASLDAELMKTPGFTLEQLMELAGLSVAEAVYQVLQEQGKETGAKILVICGPGNNGGDGLVAARHLVMFGHEATVVYPKRSTKQPHYNNLVQQCEDVGISVLHDTPQDMDQYDAVIDAIFGFSFQGAPRSPFDGILEQMKTTKAITFAVDIPSGWDVNGASKTDFTPTVLISLTAPKLCAQNFPGRHFVGGRFLPPALAAKYNVRMPPYPGVSQVWEMARFDGREFGYADYRSNAVKQNAASHPQSKDETSWLLQYAEYLAEKEAQEFANYNQQAKPKHKTVVEGEPWEVQYAAWCAEKEANESDKE